MTPTVSKSISHRQTFWNQRFTYTLVATGFSFFLYTTLYMVGAVPSQLQYHPTTDRTVPAVTAATTSVDQLSAATTIPNQEDPRRIIIDKIGVNTVVKNPVSTSIETLNSYLAEGAVRWPTSGYAGDGNLFVFGHSSSLETVWNQAYKTFNNLGDLKEGDEITVETTSGVYIYTVAIVEFKEDTAIYVPLDTDQKMLTLSTCNNLGSKEDRIVVHALFTDYTPY